MGVNIVAMDPGGNVIGEWHTTDGGEHVSMMQGEDVIHGTRGRIDPASQRAADLVTAYNDGISDGRPVGGRIAKQAMARLETLVNREELIADGEPYSVDDSIIKEDDAQVRAYMKVWDHYQAAYNAVRRRNDADLYVSWLLDMAGAIMGHPISYDPIANEPEVTRIIWEAGQERSRLLSQIERHQETLAVSADSVASQQRLIQEMFSSAAKGKRAFDAMMLLCVRLGINPVPQDPEEWAAAIMAVFNEGEQTRGAQIDRLAKFIAEEVPGEPSTSDGAVDVAIRLIRAGLAKEAPKD